MQSFTTKCPNCGHIITDDRFSDEEVEKDYYFTCDKCDKQFFLSDFISEAE